MLEPIPNALAYVYYYHGRQTKFNEVGTFENLTKLLKERGIDLTSNEWVRDDCSNTEFYYCLPKINDFFWGQLSAFCSIDDVATLGVDYQESLGKYLGIDNLPFEEICNITKDTFKLSILLGAKGYLK